MKLLPLFRSSISSALERQYLNEKWIGDQSLLTILQKNYGLKFATKGYINKYLPNMHLDKFKCYHERVYAIKNEENKVIKSLNIYVPMKREWEYVRI